MDGRNCEIGDDVDLALDVLLTTRGGLKIGDRSLIGYRTQILTANHEIPGKESRIADSGHKYSSVCIGEDCWVGANSVILPGVSIGKGSVIGAGSVVTKDIEEYSVAVGCPARVVKRRG